jgi:hypothetical protein
MDIEQLKLVLETVQHTTDGAKDIGVWWVILHYGEKILSGLFMVACVWGVAWGILKAVMSANGADSSEQRLRYVRDLLRVGSPGGVTESEFDQMRDKIRNLLKEQSK